MRVVLVGGGTGGHFYPLIAIAEALRAGSSRSGKPIELYYMGPDPYDQDALDSEQIHYVRCPSGKMRRYASALNLLTPLTLALGSIVAVWKLFVLYPDVVMSKGSYTSVPVVLAARILRIPVVIHESDTRVGRANTFASRFARYIGVAYEETAALFPQDRTALIGIPIRSKLLQPQDPNASVSLGLEPGIPVLLVLGGSQGAQNVNNLVLESLDELLPSFSILHQTGKDLFEPARATAQTLIPDDTLRARYHPVSYLSAEMLHLAYSAAELVVSRAGSTTIFETAVHGKPSILIPIPETISHDQRSNAYAYARTGGAIVMEEGNLKDGLLAAEIARIIGDQSVYRSMAEAAHAFAPADAAGKLAGILRSIGDEHGS